MNERESFKREKLSEGKPDNHLNSIDDSNHNSEQTVDKEEVKTSTEETNISKSAKSQVEIV